jgi:hypothetical protein
MIAFCECDFALSDGRGWCNNCGDRLGEDERDKEISDLRTRIAELEAAKAWKARAVEALEGVKVRAAFIGHPGESYWDAGDGHMIPDWRGELLLIEDVLRSGRGKPAKGESGEK